MKLDEAILEEIGRAGPATRVDLIQRLAGRVEPALKRLTAAGLLHRVNNNPYRRVDEKVYSLSPEPIEYQLGKKI